MEHVRDGQEITNYILAWKGSLEEEKANDSFYSSDLNTSSHTPCKIRSQSPLLWFW